MHINQCCYVSSPYSQVLQASRAKADAVHTVGIQMLCCAELPSCVSLFSGTECFSFHGLWGFIVSKISQWDRSVCVCVCARARACTLMCCAQLVNCVQLFATPCAVARQVPLSMKFSWQEYWSGLPFPLLGDLPDPGIEPTSSAPPTLAVDHWATWESHTCIATKKC